MKKILMLIVVLSMAIFVGCNEVEELPDNKAQMEEDKVSDNVILDEAVSPTTPEIEMKDEPQDEEENILPPADDEEVYPEHEKIPEVINRVADIQLSTYNVSLHVGEKKMPLVTMLPKDATDKREIWTSSDSSVATVDGLGNIKAVSEGECVITVASVDNPDVSATVKVTVLAEAELTYIEGILVVNKTYPLPPSYAPGWETEASGPLWEMIAAAEKDGIKLWMTSGYRSYYDQQYIYNNYVKRDGQEEADTYSARPGHSEHQTGLAYDLNDLTWDFGETPEGKWVAENCHKYGFILRYPKDKEAITGYIYEPWHIRYVGVEKAGEIYESGLCLEEFLNITSVYADNVE